MFTRRTFLFWFGPTALSGTTSDSSEAYLGNKYYEQSLDHLTTALKLNGSLFSQLDETKKYHAYILTLLGK